MVRGEVEQERRAVGLSGIRQLIKSGRGLISKSGRSLISKMPPHLMAALNSGAGSEDMEMARADWSGRTKAGALQRRRGEVRDQRSKIRKK